MTVAKQLKSLGAFSELDKKAKDKKANASAFYCVADYFWYKALANVSVAAGTALFNCSPLFVYGFSICWLRERVTFGKLTGVALSLAGVLLLLVYQDNTANNKRLDLSALAHLESAHLVAGLLMVLSAACYGAYEVAFQVVVCTNVTYTSTLLDTHIVAAG